MNHLEITDTNFRDEVLGSDVPVVVDFWAQWCGPCRMLGPIIEELAEEYAGRIKVGKLDTDKNPVTAQALRIAAVPTVLFFKEGRLVDRTIGTSPKTELKRRIERLL
ncbi:MAG: thioredoxin [Elusimicrobia bacterium]|nr:thioredoxin [Elusimicrobiota bacterium]